MKLGIGLPNHSTTLLREQTSTLAEVFSTPPYRSGDGSGLASQVTARSHCARHR